MLASVPDPRSPRGKQYTLEFMLAVCVVAALAGAKNYSEIARRAAGMPQSLLRKLGARWNWFTLRYQHPSEPAIRNVLKKTDAAALDAITCAWVFTQAVQDSAKNDFAIAVDGKVLRGAWTGDNGKVTLFSAMLQDEGVTVAQVRVPDGTNEITQAGAIMDAMEIPEGKTALLTLDAAHTRDETAEIIGSNPVLDYVVNVKGNRPSLQREAFAKVLPLLGGIPGDVMMSRDRGRIRTWSCWITDAEGIRFPHAAQCAFIRREIFEISGDRTGKEHALIITSRKSGKITAAGLNRYVRRHWGIENKNHYVRDTAYQEDNCQAWQGEGPQALASLRNLAISLLRLNGRNSIKETMQWIHEDRMRALQFMTTQRNTAYAE